MIGLRLLKHGEAEFDWSISMYGKSRTHRLIKLADVSNSYQAKKMFSSADDVNQLTTFGRNVNLECKIGMWKFMRDE